LQIAVQDGQQIAKRKVEIPGGTGHRPVLSGYQPDSRTHDALTKRRTVLVRSTRRQVAAEDGQVGRSTQTNCIVPAEGEDWSERKHAILFRSRDAIK
jgi:hypothetical protein